MAHVATITIDHTKVPGDLTDYVGLIVPDASAGYSALYALCLEGGGDIRLFKSDDTTELAREIVTFSVSAETGEIHYKYSGTLSSSVDTDIHVYADGSSSEPAVGATYGCNAVWTDYQRVYHLETTGTQTDSSGNGNDLSENGNPTADVGQVGKAAYLDGNGDYYTDAGIALSTGTLQGWFFRQSTDRRYILSQDKSGGNIGDYGVVYNSNNEFNVFPGENINYYTGAGTFPVSTWVNFHSLFGTGGMKVYVDSILELSASGATEGLGGSRNFLVGANFLGTQGLQGRIDEVRIRTSRLSANWITTEYNNQNSYSTFYSVAAVAGSSAAQAARRGAVMMM